MIKEEELHPEDEKRRQTLVRMLTLAGATMIPLGGVQAAWWGSSPKKLADEELKILETIVGREIPFGLESELYKGERREY